MHLDHKLPWGALASCFSYIEDNPHRTPQKTDIFARNRPDQARILNHFTKVFISTIEEFSLTERAKYPSLESSENDEKLFDDSLLGEIFGLRRENPLHSRYQLLNYWIQRAQKPEQSEPVYDTRDADLAEAVKVLLSLNKLPALLRLAQHPLVPLHQLNSLSWGHSFGFNHVPTLALRIYVLINLAERIKSTAEEGSKAASLQLPKLHSYRWLMRDVLACYDFPSQTLPHKAFWYRHGVDGSSRPEGPPLPDEWDILSAEGDQLRDVQMYLKVCFELLYRYDMVMKECNKSIDWLMDIQGCLMPFGATTKWDEKQERYVFT